MYSKIQKYQMAWQMHVCHVAVCRRKHSAGEMPCASVEAPWTPASLVPGSNPAARAAGTGSSGAAAREAKASNGWGGSLPSGVGGGGAHCCRRLGTFFLLM